MRYAAIVGIITVIFSLASGLVFAEHVVDDSKNPVYLFVISGTSGSLEEDTLTLNGVPNAVYFSDRPGRVAGHLSLEQFVESWNKGNDSLSEDPPNATLSVLKEDGAEQTVVELMSMEMKKGSLYFRVEVLEGSVSGIFQTASLFIDFAGTPFLVTPQVY